MKNFKIKYFLVAIIAGFFATACSDDNNTEPNYAAQIAKIYQGSVELSVSGSPIADYMGVGKTLEITRITNDSIVAVLYIDYGMGGSSIEKITAGAKVTYVSGKYILTGTETVTTSGSLNIKATLNGEISDDEVNVTINFIPGSMPMPIVAKFTSKNAIRTITVDASDYAKWTYFSFTDGVVATHTIYQDVNGDSDGTVIDASGNTVNENSFSWDIALHRDDIRTNNGAALNTNKTDLAEVTSIPTTGYIQDVDTDGRIIVDMSGMMTGNVKYGPFKLNEELCSWVSRDLGVMPPVYVIHKWVYIIQTKDGNYAKIQFTDRTNDEGTSGYVTFTYEYNI